jgi:hydroxypyruvate isomerase
VPRLAANLTMMFNEVDFLDRFEAASRAGFKGVEYLFPYPYQKEQLVERLQRNDLTQVLHNLPAGDWAAGERGIACLPDRVDEFQEGVGRAIEYATALGCKQLNCLSGIAPKGVGTEKVQQTFVDNLKFAADKLGKANIRLVIEAVNQRDVPGFHLRDTRHVLETLAAVDSSNAWILYDIYHMQIMEGNLAPTIEKNRARIAHMQLADNPGRHEPGTGEINYPFLFAFIDKLGWQGWIGCEYKPETSTVAGLGWTRPYLGKEQKT